MTKLLHFISLLSCSLNFFSQPFTTSHPFSGVTASSGTIDPTPPPVVNGATFGSFYAFGVSANSASAGRFSFSSWPAGATNGVNTYSTMTGSINPAKYYSITITPWAGYGISITSLLFDVRRSSTGIRNFSVRSGADGYSSNLTCSIIPTQTNISVVGSNIFFWKFDATSTSVDQRGCSIVFTGGSFTNFTTPLAIRFYAWNAEGASGTFSIDSVRIKGLASIGAGMAEITHDINSGFKLYPNPTRDGIVILETVNTTALKIEILDVLGAVVFSEANESPELSKMVLDLNMLSSGTYFIRVIAPGKSYTERFFISK